ncbi:MMPL family transporter [Amycolatopsis magusensis]|uniref:RND superfamily putative drug exporter n=1 Tax=Amycolatopsis magusensis TaxID=882444 RepID=A0ABS4PHH6_9PSEU|nr:MMPL family transporter [Amycolatopsis magusensis]MBP2178867.1 RND superfamily putative drug exporter [Amycolatopsis magusensis]
MNTTVVERSSFERLAGWSQRHRRVAVLLWIVVLAAITFASQAVGSAYEDDHALPGTESQQLQDRYGGQAGVSAQIVVRHENGVPADRVERMLAQLPHLAGPPSPPQFSEDGRTAYASVPLAEDIPVEDTRRLIDTAKAAEGDGLTVALGGDAIRAAAEGGGGPAEGAGLLASLVILVFMFGSILAASLPVLTAVFAVGSSLGVIVLASQVFTLPSYVPYLMMLVGLGVGIDYALLIFSRYRTEILRGVERDEATRTALDTAGRSVLFAGLTVIIALAGLLVLGLGSLRGVALAVAMTVLLTMVAAVTLLPALLTVFGRRIERAVTKRGRAPGDRWRKWGALVQRRPWAPLLLAVAALGVLSLPALGMRLGFADAGTESPEQPTRQAYDLLAEGFGPGFNGPLIVVAEGGDPAALSRVLEDTPGVDTSTTTGGAVSTTLVFPESGPQDEATHELVTRLRGEVLPALEARTGGEYLVGGSTAAAGDFATAVAERLPLFIGVVVLLSALLLLVVFRSILVPVKAAVLNLLSIGASLGVITLVFGEGWFGAQPGPIEAFVPVMIFAIVFGLSMDYEVFLVSRMHEEWRRSGDAARAVREGLANTGGVITAAAGIMIVVFGAFVLSADRMLQQFGLGLAVAVLLDAVVIRCLIVPAVMRLFGAKAWWLPTWLDRRLPKVALER